MLSQLQSVLIGKPLSSDRLTSEKLNVPWGLAVLSSDAISSVAYAVEEILWVLVPLIGLAAYTNMFYAAMCIIALLFILVFSYRQTIDNYPNGGGSYIVASENLGKIPGLVAASALTIDYILTVAVSTSAGAAAITSALPELLPYKTVMIITLISIVTVINLRGLKESSITFGILTYLFIISIVAMIVIGIAKVMILGEVRVPTTIGAPVEELTLLLFLKAFASGCTALTGVEAISNGIPNFKQPAQKRAKIVLGLLALLVLIIFGGLSYLATIYKTVPNHEVTVIAQIATQVFGANSIMFYVVQFATALILVIAANTAFAGLPLLFSLLGKDGYLPRQFSKRGKRLGYSNGILILGFVASILVYIFEGSTHYLLPLYAVGVFLSFTLSQGGMFEKWYKERSKGWRHKAFINGLGAVITGITCFIIGVTKFVHGAWIVFICIPLMVYLMFRIKRHYIVVANQLRIEKNPQDLLAKEHVINHIIVPVDTLNKSFVKCLNYGLTIGDTVEVYHVASCDDKTNKLREQYAELNIDVPLIIEDAPLRNINGMLVHYIDQRQQQLPRGEMVTVVIPQFFIEKWWHQILHNQTSIFLKAMLLRQRNVAVVTMPYLIEE